MSSRTEPAGQDWMPSDAAAAWALGALADRIVPWTAASQIDLTYRRPTGSDVTVTADVSGSGGGPTPGGPTRNLVIHGTPTAWPPMPPPASRLTWLAPVDPLGQRIVRRDLPLLFGQPVSASPPGDKPGDRGSPWSGWLARDGNVVHCRVDLVLAVIWALLRIEEQVAPKAVLDAHGRFPASASHALQAGFLDVPVIDAFGRVLAAWLAEAGSTPINGQRLHAGATERATEGAIAAPSVHLSCDVDRLRPFAASGSAVRGVAGQLLRGQWGRAAHLGREWRRGRRDLAATAAYEAVLNTAEFGRAQGIPTSFYFFAHEGPADGDYLLDEAPVRELMGSLAASGAEVGLHASYASGAHPERLVLEARALRDALTAVGPNPDGPNARGPSGSRQHFLRFRPPATWRGAQDAGLAHEASVGYPDHEGFRAGTCRPYLPFDLERDVALEVEVRPLVAMDVTLRNYRDLSPVAAAERIARLAAACREVGGTFSFLWHNTSHAGPWAPYAEAFRNALASVASAARS